MIAKKDLKHFRVSPGSRVKLKEYATKLGEKNLGKKHSESLKEDAENDLLEDKKALAAAQERLYASNTYSLLVMFQAMDAAGKDSVIKHVMSGVNPQGCQVFSFKQPSVEELDHDYMWRYVKALPERGRIGIFNRSYYEEVLVVRVHPELLESQHIPDTKVDDRFWKQRFEDVRNFEDYLSRNGTKIVKFFLHLSKDEQKERFLKRIEAKEKNWKFSLADLTERALWKQYEKAYEEAIEETSTADSPWYIIPADQKWLTHSLVASILVEEINKLKVDYPSLTGTQKKELITAREQLEHK